MASIRERAAALKLADKLRVGPRGDEGAAVTAAHACTPWSGLVSHLRASVKVKRRRVLLRSHADCFVGSEAVDVVMEHMNSANDFQGVSRSRDKAVFVCQVLLDRGVFEAVGGSKDRKQLLFQDSKSSLYRFVNVPPPPSVDEPDGRAPSSGLQRHGPWTSAAVSYTRLDSPVRSAPSAEAQASRDPGVSPLPESLVHEVWQEQTLLRLLNLVELPLLEGVLQCCQETAAAAAVAAASARRASDPTCEQLDRQILKAFRHSQEDEWLRAALDCLDFLPEHLVVKLSRELPFCFPLEGGSSGGAHPQGQVVECKLLLFSTLVKHYSSCERPPLLPQQMADIYAAIAELLVNAKLATALEALQLCLKLLPPDGREELRRLLAFMAQAADGQEIHVDKEVENRVAVMRSFSRAVLHSKTLTKDKEDLILLFMLSNISDIFKLPGALHKGVSERLASAAQGNLPETMGSQESRRSYTSSTKTTTDQELWALLSNIHLDTKISSKERKRLLGQFYRAHPEIFNKYFGESAPNVL